MILRNEHTRLEMTPHDVGTGISQIVPVVVAAVLELDAFIMVAQPELHIHPKLQVNLADVFIKAINKKNASSFLLETHSEHLLLRLLKRIRHTNSGDNSEGVSMRNTDLVVYWISSEERHTSVLRLGVDEDGSFNTLWPEGFFDERGEELFG